MNRIDEVVRRYEAVRSVMATGVSVFAVGDPAGASLNSAVRRIRHHVGDDQSTTWDELLRVAGFLRWRRITQPQPNIYSPLIAELSETISRETRMLRNFVDESALLDEVEGAASTVATIDNPVGTELLRSIEEVGAGRCVVIASRTSARTGLTAWLSNRGIRVVVPSELGELPEDIDVSFIVGPPIFMPRGLFPQGIVTAPATNELTFVMPAWFDQRSIDHFEYELPRSPFGEQADGGVTVRAKVYRVGDSETPESATPDDTDLEDTYYPQPFWGDRTSGDRDPFPDETEARKILLAGGLALWLDDGERIRSLDPAQPEGARIGYESIDDVAPGTYLILRDGATERQAMYDAALIAVGASSTQIEATQKRWKTALSGRLANQQVSNVIKELWECGVRSATRVRAWTEPSLICPKRAEDLAGLLAWLEIPRQPSFTHAVTLRRALYKASADLTRELEEAVSRVDLKDLERNGILHLDLPRDGFRGVIVVRVMARSPFTEIVPRQRARIPFADGGAKWLE